MRYLILSDIHANFVAFDAVMVDANRRRWDTVMFLGDAVGYYPQPAPVIQALMELEPSVTLLGNHDKLLLDIAKRGLSEHGALSKSMVAQIVKHHTTLMSREEMTYISYFEMREDREEWQAVHGALKTPWEYIDSLGMAQGNLPFLKKRVCFYGHTHIPIIYASTQTPQNETLWRTISSREMCLRYRIPPKAKLFVNPGSVGQPRDQVPYASYAIFDEELMFLEMFRVEFDITKVQEVIRQHRYPEVLGQRLTVGR